MIGITVDGRVRVIQLPSVSLFFCQVFLVV